MFAGGGGGGGCAYAALEFVTDAYNAYLIKTERFLSESSNAAPPEPIGSSDYGAGMAVVVCTCWCCGLPRVNRSCWLLSQDHTGM